MVRNQVKSNQCYFQNRTVPSIGLLCSFTYVCLGSSGTRRWPHDGLHFPGIRARNTGIRKLRNQSRHGIRSEHRPPPTEAAACAAAAAVAAAAAAAAASDEARRRSREAGPSYPARPVPRGTGSRVGSVFIPPARRVGPIAPASPRQGAMVGTHWPSGRHWPSRPGRQSAAGSL